VLEARGDRVRVATVQEQDVAPYRRAVEQSRHRLSRWNPVDPDDLDRHRPLQSRDYRTFLIHSLRPEGDHDIVGKVNVVDAVRRRFESAAIGYDAYDPYAGRGLFAEGLRLVLDLAFSPESAGGMGLHRVAATVQPGNVRSAGLLRSLGFQHEGFSPCLLWLPGADGHEAWRDHDSYVVLRDDWPAQPYRGGGARKVVVLVNGTAVSGATTLARRLAAELRIPLFSRDVMTVVGPDALWALLADSPVGAVVQGSFRPDEARSVAEGLRRCGLDPARVPEVWCSSVQDDAPGGSLGLGPTPPVDGGLAGSADSADPGGGGVGRGDGVGQADVVRIALAVRAGLAPASEI
jgi:ribosomal-protein-alanine N-acetyltransferase